MTLARRIGSAKRYYDAGRAVAKIHAAGLYLIGRIVTFEDPALADDHPQILEGLRVAIDRLSVAIDGRTKLAENAHVAIVPLSR